MGAYLRYARRPGITRYLVTLVLFALGLAAKPMLVTLPCALLLLDWWPLGRVRSPRGGGQSRPEPPSLATWPWLIWEKTPFFALSLLSSWVTLQAQGLNVIPSVTPDFATRLANAAVSYVHYLGAFAWPRDLAFLYPYPRSGIPLRIAAAAGAALLTVSAGVLLLGRRRPWLPMGWFWFLGTLVPVIGLIQVGGQARSDRYTYLALIGIAVSLVWLAAEAWPRGVAVRLATTALFAAIIAALAVSTVAYLHVWSDSITLYRHALQVTEENDLAMNNLGELLIDRGLLEEAGTVLQEAALVNPRNCLASYNLGTTRLNQNRNEEALEPYTRALQCFEQRAFGPPYLAAAHEKLGIAYLRLRRSADAERHYQALLDLAPDLQAPRAVLRELRVRQGK